ncbi:uncharacterized protein LOC109835934 isoform X2 [Asparagus officinalis]|uniref:uncharacterized protein LOC109835934 isoform X2 n=1 Tax=Asparagus officinalis TaxID=4686 RepID=UPI00098E5468|nr:uncharacterized protein LOC109835934 isoform X2 [Asparagus officinalis]
MKESLRFAEDLTLPKVQVIVMRANMNCKHCRRRVSTIISKMNGLLDYMVDMKKKEVTLRAVVDTKHINKKRRKTKQDTFDHTDNKKNPCFSGFFKTMCLGAF